MALRTLQGIEEIDGYDVKRINWNQPDQNFIEINDEGNAITFKLQNGPIKENGINGCQVNTLIETAKIIIEKLNSEFPCRENACVVTKLDEALLWLMKRKLDREKRGVEGFNKE